MHETSWQIARALRAARTRTGDACLGVGVREGKSRVVRVVKAKGKRTPDILPLTDFLPHDQTITYLDGVET